MGRGGRSSTATAKVYPCIVLTRWVHLLKDCRLLPSCHFNDLVQRLRGSLPRFFKPSFIHIYMQVILEIFGQSQGVCNLAAVAIDFSSPKVYEGR